MVCGLKLVCCSSRWVSELGLVLLCPERWRSSAQSARSTATRQSWTGPTKRKLPLPSKPLFNLSNLFPMGPASDHATKAPMRGDRFTLPAASWGCVLLVNPLVCGRCAEVAK